MTSHRNGSRRRYRKAQDRRVWVFSELNHDLTPEVFAKVIATAALEQVALERATQLGHQEQPPAEGTS